MTGQPLHPSDIRLVDLYTRRIVDAERRRRGDGTCAKTARALIHERLAQLSAGEPHAVDLKQSPCPKGKPEVC